jgi:hypothetical protein
MRCVGVVILTLLAAPAVEALDVYHWVDDAGVVHYSQWRPAVPATEFQLLTLEENHPAGQVDEDLYRIEEQAAIMRDLWQEIERKRAARRERERAIPPPAVVYYPQFSGFAFAPFGHAGFAGHPHAFHPPTPQKAPEPQPEPMRSLPFRPPGGPR